MTIDEMRAQVEHPDDVKLTGRQWSRVQLIGIHHPWLARATPERLRQVAEEYLPKRHARAPNVLETIRRWAKQWDDGQVDPEAAPKPDLNTEDEPA